MNTEQEKEINKKLFKVIDNLNKMGEKEFLNKCKKQKICGSPKDDSFCLIANYIHKKMGGYAPIEVCNDVVRNYRSGDHYKINKWLKELIQDFDAGNLEECFYEECFYDR